MLYNFCKNHPFIEPSDAQLHAVAMVWLYLGCPPSFADPTRSKAYDYHWADHLCDFHLVLASLHSKDATYILLNPLLFCRFFFPDSPTTAYFLTVEERILAVERIKVNQAGTENKH